MQAKTSAQLIEDMRGILTAIMDDKSAKTADEAAEIMRRLERLFWNISRVNEFAREQALRGQRG